MAAEFSAWQPLSVAELVVALAEVRTTWWLAGGWALDLFLGRQTRGHHDIDAQVLRPHLSHLRATLADWDMHMADPPGTLRPWPVGEELPAHAHDIWCRRTATEPWAFQLMVADTAGDDWVYRRDPRIRRPVRELSGPTSTQSLAVISPDVQLLYKSKGLRPQDQQDFDAVLPALTLDQRQWLRTALSTTSPDHPWLARLTPS